MSSLIDCTDCVNYMPRAIDSNCAAAAQRINVVTTVIVTQPPQRTRGAGGRARRARDLLGRIEPGFANVVAASSPRLRQCTVKLSKH